MSRKKYIGQLIIISFTDREKSINGLVIDYNDDWTLMKYNPVDYIIDGYIIVRHKNIKKIERDSKYKFKEKVLRLKKLIPTKEEIIPITDLRTIMEYLTEKHGVFQFETKSEKACYLGRLIHIDSKELITEFMDPEGKWDSKMTNRPGDVRVIEYDTDYINSLKLVNEYERNYINDNK